MSTHTTTGGIRQDWASWLAGAGQRRTEPVTVDDRAEVEHRIAVLASTVDPQRVWVDCPACGLDNGPYTAAEARQLAGIHDDLHHRGQPTALVVGEVIG